MMNDMMPTIEEAATPDILAQIEHEEWERGNEERERWAAVEVLHGPLMPAVAGAQQQAAMTDHSRALDIALENAFKCDEDDDEDAWFDEGPCK